MSNVAAAFTKIVAPLYTRECEIAEIEAIEKTLKTFLKQMLQDDPAALDLAYKALNFVVKDACAAGRISCNSDDFANLLSFPNLVDRILRTPPKPKTRACPGAPKKTMRSRLMVQVEIE